MSMPIFFYEVEVVPVSELDKISPNWTEKSTFTKIEAAWAGFAETVARLRKTGQKHMQVTLTDLDGVTYDTDHSCRDTECKSCAWY